MHQESEKITAKVAIEKLRSMSAAEYAAANDRVCRELIPLIRDQIELARPDGPRGFRSIDPIGNPMVSASYDNEEVDRSLDHILYLKIDPGSQFKLYFEKRDDHHWNRSPVAFICVTNPVWMTNEALNQEMTGSRHWQMHQSIYGQPGRDIVPGSKESHKIEEVVLEIWRTPWDCTELSSEACETIEVIKQFSIVEDAFNRHQRARAELNITYAMLQVMGCNVNEGLESIFRKSALDDLTIPDGR